MIRLQVHLPGQQLVVFNAESTVRNQADRIEAARRTTLTQFFELNALIKSKIDNNQNLEDWERQAYSSKYQDWPEFMTFDKKLKVWKNESGSYVRSGNYWPEMATMLLRTSRSPVPISPRLSYLRRQGNFGIG